MSQDQIQKEALFNEVKGSIFEFLVAKRLAQQSGHEIDFLHSLDQNYLNVLSQQDRMIRQFYPDLQMFLKEASEKTSSALIEYLQEIPSHPRLRGKFAQSPQGEELFEADLVVDTSRGSKPISLKLNKKHSFVNTKSGGIKSFFEVYFPFLSRKNQSEFNQFVDQEFFRMGLELHSLNDWEFHGDFSFWVSAGKSELPGELNPDERQILKEFYSRVSKKMHEILKEALEIYPDKFVHSLSALMGFSSPDILQIICYHDFKSKGEEDIVIHSYDDVAKNFSTVQLLTHKETSSVELELGKVMLQIRVKPMNKFTTTAIKINCAVKFKPI